MFTFSIVTFPSLSKEEAMILSVPSYCHRIEPRESAVGKRPRKPSYRQRFSSVVSNGLQPSTPSSQFSDTLVFFISTFFLGNRGTLECGPVLLLDIFSLKFALIVTDSIVYSLLGIGLID